jgi:mono/diheme cytochrome c family protein
VIALFLALAAGLPPQRLSETGLYAEIATRTLAPGVLAFTPQYPLWTDGATKQRWIRLPAGTAIDARDPDAWVFPVGTRLWKQFSFGRAVETRMLERLADGRWSYASYAWDAEGSEALLAPERGLKNACRSAAGTAHDIPGRMDCRACHEAGPNRVLGFNALQLSSDRDPLALHAETPAPGSVDLATLVERGLVRGLPAQYVANPPRIPARSPRERAALGYLQANCSDCHNSRGELAPLGLHLDNRLAARGSPLDSLRPRAELLQSRMGTREPLTQMPPLGTQLADAQALEFIRAWIREELGPGERDPFQTQARSTKP